jgi:hypothetical protein
MNPQAHCWSNRSSSLPEPAKSRPGLSKFAMMALLLLTGLPRTADL